MTQAIDPARYGVAIAHDYLTQRGGAERVVLSLARAFPEAPIYTTLYDPDTTFPEFRFLDVRPSWLNAIPAFRRHHRLGLPLLPMASKSITIDADVVVASSSGWAHGFETRGELVVYCHAPARWLYQADVYLGTPRSLAGAAALKVMSPALRRWDRMAAGRADRYLANSSVVKQRVRDAYGRNAVVVPAPVAAEVENVQPTSVELPWGPDASFMLCVSRLLPYKNVRQVVEAFRARPGRRLVIVGVGPERERLAALCPPNVVLLSGLADGEMKWLYQRSTGLVAASHEDFGLTPLEAAAQGKPSAVLRAGGFLDTMVEHETAVFFDVPEPEAIAVAVDQLHERTWDEQKIRARAAVFGEADFIDRIRDVVTEAQVAHELAS
jgi:glycosyltransferase involved in cell wall biosynthesis